MDVSGELFLVGLIVRSYCLYHDLKQSFKNCYSRALTYALIISKIFVGAVISIGLLVV